MTCIAEKLYFQSGSSTKFIKELLILSAGGQQTHSQRLESLPSLRSPRSALPVSTFIQVGTTGSTCFLFKEWLPLKILELILVMVGFMAGGKVLTLLKIVKMGKPKLTSGGSNDLKCKLISCLCCVFLK